MKTNQHYTIIAALDSENGIARDGSIPWHLPGDLAHFRGTTSAEYIPGKRNLLIVGRTTWESIPSAAKPGFANRDIIILTHAPDYAVSSTFSPSATPESEEAAHITTAASVDEAFARAKLGDKGHVFIIGGEQIYEQTISRPEITQLILTRVDGNFDCDQFFPHIPASFTQTTTDGPFNDSSTPYSIHTYIQTE